MPRKWFFPIIFLSIIIGLGILIFFLLTQKEPTENFEGDIDAPFSSIYRYGADKKDIIFDQGNTWHNANFVRYIYDTDGDGSGLQDCYYFFYDNVLRKLSSIYKRNCNKEIEISVGENENCSSQGKNACTLYVYAKDRAGNEKDNFGITTYNIDFTSPTIGEIQKEKDKYFADVSDNIGVNYCWLYVDGKKTKAMELEPFPCLSQGKCLASIDYPVSLGKHLLQVKCADQYEAQINNYLNIGTSLVLAVEIKLNQSPEILSCKVEPTQGTLATEFQFEVEANDPDNDKLFYFWDFGDSATSVEKEPTHFYKNIGLFKPKVIVSDGYLEVICSTAWVEIRY